MWQADAATSSIFATLTLNIAIAAVCIIAFEWLRNAQLDIYSPKLRKENGHNIPPPGKGWFGWMAPVWKASDEDVLRIAGMDAYVLLRHFKMCYKICVFAGVGAVILLAVYYTSFDDPSQDDDNDTNKVIGIALYSMANVPNRGRRLWASVIFVYLFTFVFLYYIDAEYANFAQMRAKYSKGGEDGLPPQMHYTVQIENIPDEFRTSPRLKDFVETLFPGEVLHTYVSISLKPLEKVVAERSELLARLEDTVAAYEADDRKTRPTLLLDHGVLPKPRLCCGTPGDKVVDAIDYLSDQISILCAEIEELQAEARVAESGEDTRFNRSASWLKISDKISLTDALKAAEDSKAMELLKKATDAVVSEKIKNELDAKVFTTIKGLQGTISSRLVSATGFVTFRSKRTQAVAVGLSSLSAQYPDLQVSAAPAPSDIVWTNLSASTEHTDAMTYFTSAAYYTGLLFWTVILTFIAGLSNLQKLAEYMPFLNDLDDTSYALLQGILPVLVMMIFLSLLPYFMALISVHIERRKTVSSTQEQVFKWFFLYQIANVYLLLLAGSAVTSVSDVVDDPAGILYAISTALPSTSVFFINYLITTAFTGVTTNYLQIGPALYFAAMRVFYKEKRLTRRMLFEGPLASISVNYGATLPDGLYVLCIVLLYWVIAPFIIYVALIYFGAAYLCWKYQFLYVYERSYESGGKFWYGLFTYSMVALMASTVTMIVYMSIKEGIAQAPALLPVLGMIVYQWRRTESRYKALSQVTPYSTAVQVDLNSEAAIVVDTFTDDYLKQPCMIAPVRVSPYPYRVHNTPLLNTDGLVQEVYLSEMPPEDARGVPLGPSAAYVPPRPADEEAPAASDVTSAMHTAESKKGSTRPLLGSSKSASAGSSTTSTRPHPFSKASSVQA